MESNNSFNKGMDLDTNPLNLEKGKYRQANNIRVLNDVGSTSFSVNNIKGNEFNLTFPTTPIIQKITVTDIFATQTLTINGQTGAAFNTTGMSPYDLYTYIVNDGTYSLLGVEYNIYYGNSYLVIVPVSGFTVTISTFGTGLVLDSSFIPAQIGVEVIGSVNLRGDLYYFTTNNATKNPGGHSNDSSLPIDASSVGQIWRYTYDKITLAGTLTLIYNNYVNFSTYYCIAPNAITARYENPLIQRIYFTDNYNKFRTINVADPNSLAVDLSILDIQPAIDMDKAIMTEIKNDSSGSLLYGAYQIAYRYSSIGGAVTNFSELSDILYITQGDEQANIAGTNFIGYIGGAAGGTVAKTVKWTINNLDTDYDRIEVAILYKVNINDIPTILLLDSEPISGLEFFNINYNGTQDTIPMTLTEFLDLAGAFTHCKTIGTKDNRLFAANIRNQMSEIDFDARAYRWDNSPILELTENGTNNTYTLATLDTISETSDAINPNSSLYKYKSDGVTIGGEGINISYEFYTIAIATDVDSNASGPFGVPDLVYAPWRHTNPDYTNTAVSLDLGVKSFSDNFTQVSQLTPTGFPNAINDGMKYVPYNSSLRGFQRNETYRFGIQFFDKAKNPTFVKWISDIKMPDYFDINTKSYYANGVATGITDFRLAFVANRFTASGMSGYNESFVQTLGIDFTVNIPADLTELIDGYSIVRVKREEEDKTIIAQGYLNIPDIEPGGSKYYMTKADPSSPSMNFGTSDSLKNAFFITPNLCDGALIAPTSGMTLSIDGVLVNANTDAAISFGGDPYWMYKLYNHENFTRSSGTLNQCDYISYAGNILDSGTSTDVYNYDYGSSPSFTTSYSVGNPAYYIRTTTNIPWTFVASYPAGKLLATISRTLSSQYGGNTYSARANNTYISCSHYRPIRITGTTITDNSPLILISEA